MSDQSGSWQPDPFGRHQYRYWNGTEWSDQVSDDGVVSADPATAEGAAAAAADVPAGPDPTQVGGWGTPPPDPTVAQPAATPAPGYGAPVPAATAPTKSSGNTPALIIGGVLLLALLGAGAYLLFGGSDDDDGPDREALVASLTDLGLSGSEANCVIDEVGLDLVHELDTDPDGASSADRAKLNDAIAECQGGGDDTTTTTEADETTTTTEADETTTTAPQTTTTADAGGTTGLLPGNTYGDNPVLDDMWDDCEAGDRERCLELYMSSEFGSEYEAFGLEGAQP